MNDIKSYEKIVARRTEGKILLAKIALIFAYVIFAAVGFLLVLVFAEGSPALLLIVGALDSLLILFTWKLTCIEYEYTLAANTFYLAKIFGKSRRKEFYEEELIRASFIAPYNEKYSEKAENCKPNDIIWAVSTKNAPDIWFIIFEEESAKKTLVFFEADERAISTLRHYCPRATVRDTVNFKAQVEEQNTAEEENKDA